MRKTVIVIPCYNEALRIQQNEFIQCCDSFNQMSFIFVNDDSKDNTGEILTKLKNIKPEQISVINLSKNSGKAEAVRQGMLTALHDNFDYIGYWDADLSTSLSHIKSFVDALEKSTYLDIVMGSRVQLLGRSISRRAHRHYVGRIFATWASIMLHLPVYDTQCGAKLFRNSPLLHQILEEQFKTSWIFDVEILARYISKCHYTRQEILAGKIIEYPLDSWSDISGSKIKLKDFFKISLELFRFWYYYHKDLAKIKENH